MFFVAEAHSSVLNQLQARKKIMSIYCTSKFANLMTPSQKALTKDKASRSPGVRSRSSNATMLRRMNAQFFGAMATSESSESSTSVSGRPSTTTTSSVSYGLTGLTVAEATRPIVANPDNALTDLEDEDFLAHHDGAGEIWIGDWLVVPDHHASVSSLPVRSGSSSATPGAGARSRSRSRSAPAPASPEPN